MAIATAKTRKSERASSSKARDGTGRQIGAFSVLEVGTHYCYMRAHEGDDERTMFLVNLPTDTTDRHLKAIFAQAGAIESVKLWKGKAANDLQEAEEEELALVKGKSAAKKDSGPPKVITLPPLDPRYPHHFLPTATSAHITFLDESSLERALSQTHLKAWPRPFHEIDLANAQISSRDQEATSTKKKKRNSIKTAAEAAANDNVAAPPTGLEYLMARHRSLRPALGSVKAHVDSVIANYEYRRAHPLKKKSGIQAVSVGPNGELLDEDGFVIVQSTGKYGRTQEGEGGASFKVARRRGAAAELEEEAAREKKKKRFELDDFYRFQRREEKREELANLRSKFREDQEKVKKLKASRNFKPF
ncbi:hypothetical protein CBS101457_000598 [Exobasidium rhododendri]|nr:hypothetical protein CBS101457_000598 [Exobasidium rhododendri]